jgi:hypothetical protein
MKFLFHGMIIISKFFNEDMERMALGIKSKFQKSSKSDKIHKLEKGMSMSPNTKSW